MIVLFNLTFPSKKILPFIKEEPPGKIKTPNEHGKLFFYLQGAGRNTKKGQAVLDGLTLIFISFPEGAGKTSPQRGRRILFYQHHFLRFNKVTGPEAVKIYAAGYRLTIIVGAVPANVVNASR